MITQFTNQQAEMAILGTCIMNNVHILKVADILENKHFYFQENKAIWNRFIEVANQDTVDSITLKGFFEANEHLKAVGGSSYLSLLLTHVNAIFDIRNYALELIELWKKRELESKLPEILAKLSEKKADYVSAEIENHIAGLSLFSEKRRTDHISKIVDEIKRKREMKIETRVFSTGFRELDKKLQGGIYSKQLVVIGARPAVGKTTLLQDLIVRMSRAGKSCLFISLEVDSERVTCKFLSNMSSVAAWKIRRNLVNATEFEHIQKAENELEKMGIYLNDSEELKSVDIERIIKRQLDIKPVDVVAVDYIQHIRYDNEKNMSATMEISKNVVALKAMAKKFDIALVAAAQINRAGTDKPTLAHFEGSSAIEKNADVAIIIHREELEDQQRKESYYSETGSWIIAKNRDGKTGEIAFRLDGEFGRFSEIEGL